MLSFYLIGKLLAKMQFWQAGGRLAVSLNSLGYDFESFKEPLKIFRLPPKNVCKICAKFMAKDQIKIFI